MTDIEGESHLIEVLALWGIMMLIGAAMLVWAIWIRRHVQAHGRRTSFALFNWAPVMDYRQSRQIAREEKRIPWFVRLFEVLLGSALTGILAVFVWVWWRAS